MMRGSMVALVTPMHNDGAIDWPALSDLVDWHLDQGTHAIVAVGTTGESATLSMREHLQVISKVVDQVHGRVPVIAGTGANSLGEALELTEGAKQAKVDACLLVTPYYNKPTQEGLYLFHKAIADQIAIPQLLYNVPGRTAVDLEAATVGKLAKVDHIIGIKEATADMQRLKDIQAQVPETFVLVSGDDLSALEFMELGGHGAISVTANVAPKAFAQMCDLAAQGQFAQAKQIDLRLQSLNKTLFLESNPIPVKWVLAELGRISSGIRLPLTPLSDHFHEVLRASMMQADILEK